MKTKARFLLIAMAVGAGLLVDVPAHAGAVEDLPIYAGHDFTRLRRKYCASVCVDWKTRYNKGEPVDICIKFAPDCGAQAPGYALFTDWTAAQMVSAYNPPDWNQGPAFYEGCGPQAALNVLNYYGIHLPIHLVAGYVNSFPLPGGSFATLPDDLAWALSRLLREYGDGEFVVKRRSGVDVRGAVAGSLHYGRPIIVPLARRPSVESLMSTVTPTRARPPRRG